MKMISTRGRYALRVMADLASFSNGECIPMKEVAARQDISLKYLEQILPVLTKHGLVEAVHGKGGGYRLTRKPSEYKIGEILRLTEDGIAPVACLAEGAPQCEFMEKCHSIGFWRGLDKLINEYMDDHTLADLL